MIVKEFEKSLGKTRQGTLMPVHVAPKGKKFAIIGFDEWKGSLSIRLQSKAEKGKANQELVKELRRILGADVEILSGEKQRKKMLLVSAEKKRVLECLSSLLGQKA